MKNDGIAKDPPERMNEQSPYGVKDHTCDAGRIHFSRRQSQTTSMTAIRWPREPFFETDKRDSGYTLIELLIIMIILGLLMSFAMPTFFTSLNNSRATTCLLYRQNIQVAANIYIRMNSLQVDDDMPTIANLISEGILPEEHQCPGGGVYVWNNNKYKGIADPYFLYCSVHFAAP